MPWKETKNLNCYCVFLQYTILFFSEDTRIKRKIIMDPSWALPLIEEHANGDKEYYAIYIQPKYIVDKIHHLGEQGYNHTVIQSNSIIQ